jgi:hypothetical protein
VGELLLDERADLFGAHVALLSAEHVPDEGTLGSEPVPHLLKGPCSMMSHRICKFIATAYRSSTAIRSVDRPSCPPGDARPRGSGPIPGTVLRRRASCGYPHVDTGPYVC